jgi:anti-anti-sigma factor
MNTTINEVNGELVAVFSGRLDTAAAVQTERDVQPLTNCDGKDVVLDCHSLEYISSSGLRIFLSVLKAAKAKGRQVFITGMNDDIRNVFAMTGFTNLFQFR